MPMYDFTLVMEGREIGTVRAADTNEAMELIMAQRGPVSSIRGLRQNPTDKTPVTFHWEGVMVE